MGLRDRLEKQASRLGESTLKASASAPIQRVGESFRGFQAMLVDDGQVLSIEAYLLALVQAVLSDERDEEQSKRDVYLGARKRRRRLGLISFSAGPLAGVASRVADLYCEAATVCDVADLHDLNLTDEQIAAHMLVLWSIADDLEQAKGAMRGEPSVTEIFEAKLLGRTSVASPERLTKLAVAKVLWEFHQSDVRSTVAGAKKAASGQPIRSVAFTGHRTKKVINRAELQLGVEMMADRTRKA